ncbi:MAG: hypothetical protein IJC13_08250 [Clostridia bacterium]|nr:hypothetical protein [Clostridia bacterium]
MKKAFALFLSVLMLFSLAACGNNLSKDEDAAIVAFYSVKSAEGEFIVEVQNLGGVYSELYDENGIYIKFAGSGEEIYDKEGNKLSREDLNYGDTLEIHYNGELYRKNPKTIKATKIVKIV